MQVAYKFDGEIRELTGTGAARALRNVGKVPAIIYGDEKNSEVRFAIIEKDLKREYQKGGFFGKIVSIVVGGKEINCIAKDLQVHPVKGSIVHADFVRVTEDKKVKALVPVRFINRDRCVGIRRGGNLNVVRFEVELLCPVNNIPEKIEIDLLNVNIGESIHISRIELPEGVAPTIARDFTIAAIAGRASKAGEAEAAAA
jgi:large subunit ribosomal protein L25